MKLVFLFSALILVTSLSAQYAPAAGQVGTTAISSDSSIFIDWVLECSVQRGLKDISKPDSGYASVGGSDLVIGPAGDGVVSLGDGGSAIVTFNTPISNGPGFDFAVFENSFSDDYLELAFVEVSSNGVDYFRFPAASLTQTDTQTGGFGSTNATQVNNLAGKYRALFGTPFDLSEMAGIAGLNINQIVYVKIIDVVGNIAPAYATHDASGRVVNDPWPTLFPSSGFDLDAVGVIHNTSNTSVAENISNGGTLSGNPIHSNSFLSLPIEEKRAEVSVSDLSGRLVLNFTSDQVQNINLESLLNLPSGSYLLSWKGEKSWGQFKITK